MERLGNRSVYWNSFLKGLERFQINPNDFMFLFHQLRNTGRSIVHQEPAYAYSEIPEYKEHANVLLDGYYQSRNYFAGYEKEIMELIWGVNQRVLGRFIDPTNTSPRIGMHFRIGDYKNIQHCHPLMPTSYYVNALTMCLKEHGYYLEASMWNGAVEKVCSGPAEKKLAEVVYLCEESDVEDVATHLSMLRKEFPYLSFVRGTVEIDVGKEERASDRDWKEMALLSGCDWFVIPNSTFSWWAATFSSLAKRYVNQDEITRRGVGTELGIERGKYWVYYPSAWFGPTLAPNHDTSYLLNQKGWKCV
jgi:hypothetical protein